MKLSSAKGSMISGQLVSFWSFWNFHGLEIDFSIDLNKSLRTVANDFEACRCIVVAPGISLHVFVAIQNFIVQNWGMLSYILLFHVIKMYYYLEHVFNSVKCLSS